MTTSRSLLAEIHARPPGLRFRHILPLLLVAVLSSAVTYQWNGRGASRLSPGDRREAMKTAEGPQLKVLAAEELRHIYDGARILREVAERDPHTREHVNKVLPMLMDEIGKIQGE